MNPILFSILICLTSQVRLCFGLDSPHFLIADGGGCKFAELLRPYLDYTDEDSKYVNITWAPAGQNHVHFQGKHVPFF